MSQVPGLGHVTFYRHSTLFHCEHNRIRRECKECDVPSWAMDLRLTDFIDIKDFSA